MVPHLFLGVLFTENRICSIASSNDSFAAPMAATGSSGRRTARAEATPEFFDIHTLIVDEAFLSGNEQTDAYATNKVSSQADKPTRSHWRHLGDRCVADGRLRCTDKTNHKRGTNDDNVRHTLPDRSIPTRRVQEVRRELGPHHSSVRRTPCRVFSSSRRNERCGLGVDRIRQPGFL